ncbi:hypothetical protein PUN28_003656 [Cardiocondyla obscurior]|uniref:Uncharacterized protein n=1 Tax=Cardiocondyla obscurior TaxID=286306 RepID=A0AAW2GNV2_9HYME
MIESAGIWLSGYRIQSNIRLSYWSRLILSTPKKVVVYYETLCILNNNILYKVIHNGWKYDLPTERSDNTNTIKRHDNASCQVKAQRGTAVPLYTRDVLRNP